ncbi:MAG: glycosidase [Candidatus Raymondbacteria bacterium RifOxyA12_full_50_37]|uniref:Glycosidase n=1 Tax=Candidatus Raymondbacteria bacterium RIFOXYD12_FULL_49_13 TaxID=1817890 RepID=A0A1F7F3X0_UNCRA|nr:MAG: glycosidase [Candidatus Raymondbacteria bacterium RifOxyA12_full_50_37]OGJ90374.1 MAG: glycosidase [Candidatus Raymondbacteria bacterium RIFOXYA2_FULL_49_16]OGK01331.1 MAG: glycosidase [Candidatus Raymondbacteria bacterium RIFOXYD12_FULL_49_13]OGP43274.1 MAG: glycosidase [Candidatus Raymondbacteria bacterium RIFOXYB2_FULL_49_35]
MRIRRSSIVISPDPSRVLLRPFIPANESRIRRIIERVLSLSETEIAARHASVMDDFSSRHVDITRVLNRHFQLVRAWLPNGRKLSEKQKSVIGAYFTSEYSVESAAIFNPSIVPHPDQSGLAAGAQRFVMSLRATGEGHISSLVFRTGILDCSSNLSLDFPSKYVCSALPRPEAVYDKKCFVLKLSEMRLDSDFSRKIMQPLAPLFTIAALMESLKTVTGNYRRVSQADRLISDKMLWLACSNYEIVFAPGRPLSERIVFPASPSEQNGIEDARFVLFTGDDGSRSYYATYTAYDGKVILPQIMETADFSHFKMITLNGKAVENKGMALFPRKINGKYAMLSRQDNENLFLMYSDNIHFWQEAQLIGRPSHAWEFVQLGNCGSPIETEAGWVVLTHGVGPMRTYCIGALLLDLADPSKIIGRLKTPLLEPLKTEREGYVPNVVYTCGAMVNNDELFIPYAMSDRSAGFASVALRNLIAALKAQE